MGTAWVIGATSWSPTMERGLGHQHQRGRAAVAGTMRIGRGRGEEKIWKGRRAATRQSNQLVVDSDRGTCTDGGRHPIKLRTRWSSIWVGGRPGGAPMGDQLAQWTADGVGEDGPRNQLARRAW